MVRKYPWAISDRSGMRFPMNEMVKEPGTGFLVHKSESDGIWNLIDHPQNHLSKYATLGGDPKPVKNARPDISYVVDMYLTTANEDYVTDQYGSPIEVD